MAVSEPEVQCTCDYTSVCTIPLLTDPIVVGYERTVYTTPEGARQVELCAVVTDPPTGGAPREFFLLATTEDGTAGRTTSSGLL